ncbi:hypothetical protein [Bacillus benzoevorans]|uniref:Uncharacterized protein n=1 Tax=Bacillus benzoevorans TaxID=1456 RepID=A0A7X0HV47_9BACI|nr:hypothetical protein [Bacillus benzoevorans]
MFINGYQAHKEDANRVPGTPVRATALLWAAFANALTLFSQCFCGK